MNHLELLNNHLFAVDPVLPLPVIPLAVSAMINA